MGKAMIGTRRFNPWFRVSGFTLIELLVVVAITAILAALLFPIYNSAVAAAKSSICISHLRQLASASLAYTGDHNGKLPASNGYDPSVETPDHSGFCSQLFPYLTYPYTALFCPLWPWGITGTPSPYGGAGFNANHANYSFATYSAFYQAIHKDGSAEIVMGATFTPPWTVEQRALATIQKPSSTMIYACAGSSVNPPYYAMQLIQTQPSQAQTWDAQGDTNGPFLHRGRRNFAFADGHVEGLTTNEAANRCLDY